MIRQSEPFLFLCFDEWYHHFFHRSLGSGGKGKESEYENLGSETGESDLELGESDRLVGPAVVGGGEANSRPAVRDSEQREIDEFEEEERRLLAEEEMEMDKGLHNEEVIMLSRPLSTTKHSYRTRHISFPYSI